MAQSGVSKKTFLCSWRNEVREPALKPFKFVCASPVRIHYQKCCVISLMSSLQLAIHLAASHHVPRASGCCCFSLAPPTELEAEGPRAPACALLAQPRVCWLCPFSVSWAYLRSLVAPFSSQRRLMCEGRSFLSAREQPGGEAGGFPRLSLPLALQVSEPRGVRPVRAAWAGRPRSPHSPAASSAAPEGCRCRSC